VRRLGERGLALAGGLAVGASLVLLPLLPVAGLAAPLLAVQGLGFYMLHNTLQTNATQMAPEMRGLAVAAFASCFFLGQALGVWLAGHAVDRLGFAPVFVACGILVALLATSFAAALRRRASRGGAPG
jgi:YNFM family putative membrane transporter